MPKGPWEKYAAPEAADGPWKAYASSSQLPNDMKGSISAAPEPSWFDQAHEDLLQGGNRTILGRTLGHLQGRGAKGYSGLEAGVSPGVANLMGSPELGAAEALGGLNEIAHGHPLSGAWDTVKGTGHALELPSMVMGVPGLGLVERGLEAIPSTARAGNTLGSIEQAAENVPVGMKGTVPALAKFEEHVATGGKNADVMNLLKNRIEESPINFPEARKFYTNVSDVTKKPSYLAQIMDKNAARSARMRRAAGGVREALNADLTQAAESIGKGGDYSKAMREYRNAARMKKALKVTGGIAAAEAARRTGLLGKIAHQIVMK